MATELLRKLSIKIAAASIKWSSFPSDNQIRSLSPINLKILNYHDGEKKTYQKIAF